MLFYYGVMAFVCLVGAGLHIFVKDKKRVRLIFSLFAFLVLGTLSAFRYDVGIDYSYIYAPLYEPVLADPFGPFSQSVHEPGFVLLEKIIALCSKNYQALFIVTSYLIVGLIMLFYYLHAPNTLVSVFLFLALSQYYCSMNFIRQTIAAVVGLYAMSFLMKRKFIPYLLLVLVAATFHKSALLLLPFYIINLLRIHKYTLFVYLPLTIIVYLNSTGAITFVTNFVYGTYDMENAEVASGFPVGFFIIALVSFAFLFANQKLLLTLNPRYYVYINYAYYAMLFIFLGTRHAILDRFSLYFELAVPVGASIVISKRLEQLPHLKGLWAQAGKGRRQLVACALSLLLVVGGGLGAHQYALSKDNHGVRPYQTVFSQPFYQEYKDSLRNG